MIIMYFECIDRIERCYLNAFFFTVGYLLLTFKLNCDERERYNMVFYILLLLHSVFIIYL